MRFIRNDRATYKTRESLSSVPKSTSTRSKPDVEFEFEVHGHYVKRWMKSK